MSLQSKKELLKNVHARYERAAWKQRRKILDEFVEATGYHRKYALQLLNSPANAPSIVRLPRQRRSRYSAEAVQALVKVWTVANQICGKRLVAIMADFARALERVGQLKLSEDAHSQLLSMSPATVDRILAIERKKSGGGKSTTKAGTLLKKQIPVRTFAEWNDVVPGFFEADLVAHCGETVAGTFLNTLVLTDIATGWTEFLPLLHKNEANVVEALRHTKEFLLPVPLQGLDTDNGSEFINYGLLSFCQTEEITFTRSRPYKKNDQAHVEEKNGSIIRKMVGYDRYEGARAYVALAALYEKLRVYVNFFQPSMKLISKERIGAKVRKKYDRAQTPYQRILKAPSVSSEDKILLQSLLEQLEPVGLFQEIEKLQEAFWRHSWKKTNTSLLAGAGAETTIISSRENASDLQETPVEASIHNRRYRKSQKSRKKMEPRKHRTWKDAFELVREEIEALLRADPSQSATGILHELQRRYPGQFADKLKRTLQRRVQAWREQNTLDSPTKIPSLSELLPKQQKEVSKCAIAK